MAQTPTSSPAVFNDTSKKIVSANDDIAIPNKNVSHGTKRTNFRLRVRVAGGGVYTPLPTLILRAVAGIGWEWIYCNRMLVRRKISPYAPPHPRPSNPSKTRPPISQQLRRLPTRPARRDPQPQCSAETERLHKRAIECSARKMEKDATEDANGAQQQMKQAISVHDVKHTRICITLCAIESSPSTTAPCSVIHRHIFRVR